MSENFTQLDELIESDILEALGESAVSVANDNLPDEVTNIPEELLDPTEEIEEIDKEEIDKTDCENDTEEPIDINELDILPMAEIESALENQEEELSVDNINNINTVDLATLLSQLLNNKTIEITIKVKD
jgi:hypothetical protein